MDKDGTEVLIREKCWRCDGLGYKRWHGTSWFARHTGGKCEICHGSGKAEEWVSRERFMREEK
jgi:hypothetical protein